MKIICVKQTKVIGNKKWRSDELATIAKVVKVNHNNKQTLIIV